MRKASASGGAAACGETPSVLAVLTPDEATDFTLNGANVRVTSLVVFQWLSANSLAAIVQSGRFEVIGGQTAGREQTLLAVTDNDGRVVYWSAPRTSTAGESRAATITAAAFAGGGLPVTSPPTPTAEPPPTLPPPACGSSVTHVVQPGETVFRIAQRYGSTVNVIAAANGLANPNQIRVGQTLSIPCGVDSGAPSTGDAAPSAATPVSGDSTTLDCSALTGSLPPNVPPIMLDMLRQMCGS